MHDAQEKLLLNLPLSYLESQSSHCGWFNFTVYCYDKVYLVCSLICIVLTIYFLQLHEVWSVMLSFLPIGLGAMFGFKFITEFRLEQVLISDREMNQHLARRRQEKASMR